MRKGAIYTTIIYLFIAVACVKPYEPKVIKAANNFLVVDGIINCAPNGETKITLTRTRKLSDTVTSIPELQAQIAIEGQGGDQYGLQEKDSGVYHSSPLTLNAASRYRLLITTAGGSSYASDFVPVKITPPIDSLNWKQDGDNVTIYLTTHDPQNSTRYYRWEYDETWKYYAEYESVFAFRNSEIVYRKIPDEMVYQCWRTTTSTDILQQSTAQLSQDAIQQTPVAVVPVASSRFQERYSINVKQFALTKEAYEYWQILKRNTQQLGSLFDAQPSQLIGNLHNVANKEEPVIGFITAAAVQEKRMFIKQTEVTGSHKSEFDCSVLVFSKDEAARYLSENAGQAPAYGVTGGGIAISSEFCVDCRLVGGTTIKPLFWP
jgi:hypothetical protein